MNEGVQEIKDRLQKVEDDIKVFKENKFLKSLPGKMVALESFVESYCKLALQHPEELKTFLDSLVEVSERRWRVDFPFRTMSDIETLERLRKPLDAFIESLRAITSATRK